MNYKQLTIEAFKNSQQDRERIIGKYWASELYDIATGRITPENFFEKREITDFESIWRILWGTIGEEFVAFLFEHGQKEEYKRQNKITLEYEDLGISLICKPDFLFKEKIIEVKCPDIIPDKIKDYHKPQLEAYWQAYQLPIYITYANRQEQKIKSFQYNPSEKYWEKIMEKVKMFHNSLVEKYPVIPS